VIPWRDVTPFEELNGELGSTLETVDSLRSVWERVVEAATPEERAEARRRNLRQHAIETGIIERLYDVDWSVTEALVAEGLTLEAAEAAEGSISPAILDVIRSQLEALEYLAEVARGNVPLSIKLIREVHEIITRHQATYDATDLLGNRIKADLHHGQWKTWPNHVRREDGSLLQYAPPEQVQQQTERLVTLHRDMDDIHPLKRAAWLHHRFICIHPFEDGNGRVGRALLLLDMLKGRYAPLVVDRTRRDEYIASLEAANEDDLSRLVRLFCDLERVALQAELHGPIESIASRGAISVARASVARISDRRRSRDEERQRLVEALAAQLQEHLRAHLDEVGGELRTTFRDIDPQAYHRVYSAAPPDPRSTWWRHQLIRAAREVKFWTNLTGGTWWVDLGLSVVGQPLRYVAAIQRVGDRDVGVMALTVFAEMPQSQPEGAEAGPPVIPIPLIRLSSTDSVTLLAEQAIDDVWPEAQWLIDRTLAAAVHEFSQQLS